MIYNTLIIDDHPMIVEGYKSALNHIEKNTKDINFEISIASNCDTALDKIKNSSTGKKFDLVFLDIQLSPSKDGTVLSGEDLGVKIRQLFDDVLIIVATTFNDNFRLNNIIHNVEPDALMVKNDLTTKSLKRAIEAVLNNESYYCKTASKLIRSVFKNDFILDRYDRRLLHELSIGTKMKDMPNKLPFSIGGIEQRKRKLKEVFNISSIDDRKLIQIAREKGFI